MSIKIWHQSFTTLARVPEYNQVLREHIGKVVRADTVVDVHGAHLTRPFFGAGDQECGGIGAAAQGDCQGQWRRKALEGRVKRRRHRIKAAIWRWPWCR